MNLVQLTPGAGGMFCGNCLRDNALVAELRRLGHSALMVPLYLPLRLDEADQSAGTPIHYSGINVYLQQKIAAFRSKTPRWLHRWFQSPFLLRMAAGRAAQTRPDHVGELAISMLRGERGHQARELDELVNWLRTHGQPDWVCLSNALLVGMARRIKSDAGARVACMMQGEDGFLDALPREVRDEAWKVMGERLREVDVLMAPSRYFAEVMAARAGLPVHRVAVVPNGINLSGYLAEQATTRARPSIPVLGFFARLCADKGLDTLVDAFVILRRRGRVPSLRLHVGGSCGPADEKFVDDQVRKLDGAGLRGSYEIHPNVSREAKVGFLGALSVFSVPARCGEAFGLYAVEAMAAGVPLVQPRAGAFPELLHSSGSGVLCEPENPESLADAVEHVLQDPSHWQSFADAGLKAARERYHVRAMALGTLAALGKPFGTPEETRPGRVEIPEPVH